jgi:hypothetical protein
LERASRGYEPRRGLVTLRSSRKMVPRLQTPQRRRRTSGLARWFMAESRGPEPHTFRCHRCSKPCRRACPVDSPKWRTAEALIPSAEAPTRFPIEAGGAPVHCPNGGMTAGLHRSASRRPSVFKAAPARLSGSSSRAALTAFAARTAVSSLPLKGGPRAFRASNLATTIGLEPTSSTFGGSCSSS